MRYREIDLAASVDYRFNTIRGSSGARQVVFRQQSVPVPLTQFCRQMGISTRKFYYWRQRLREMDAAVLQGLPRHPIWIVGAGCRRGQTGAQPLPSCRCRSSTLLPQPPWWRSNFAQRRRWFGSPVQLTPPCFVLQPARLANSMDADGETTDVPTTPRLQHVSQ